MKRIVKIRLYPTKEQRNVLEKLQIKCSKLYNYANYLTRQNYFKTGTIYNYNTLCKLLKDTKDYKALPYIEKVSPPKYKKNRRLNKTIPMNIPIKSNRSYKLTDYGFEFTKKIKKLRIISNKI